LNLVNSNVPETLPICGGISDNRNRLKRLLRGSGITALMVIGLAGVALAQSATAPSGSIGAQVNSMSGEMQSAGGTAFSVLCYIAAALTFAFGAWSIWQSRQPQNRETGYLTRGLVGLVLCGVFATSGVWINKAAMSASGGNATITTNHSMVQFGSGGGG
jgi:uncharacterized membrane protein